MCEFVGPMQQSQHQWALETLGHKSWANSPNSLAKMRIVHHCPVSPRSPPWTPCALRVAHRKLMSLGSKPYTDRTALQTPFPGETGVSVLPSGYTSSPNSCLIRALIPQGCDPPRLLFNSIRRISLPPLSGALPSSLLMESACVFQRPGCHLP